jgi:predicted methyltransferase
MTSNINKGLRYISYQEEQTPPPRCGCELYGEKICLTVAEEIVRVIPRSMIKTLIPNSDDPEKEFATWLTSLDKENVISFIERLLDLPTIDNNIKEKLKDFLDKIRRVRCNNCGHRGCNGC